MTGVDGRNAGGAGPRPQPRWQARPSAPPAGSPNLHAPRQSEYAFLLRRRVNARTLAHAEAVAARWRVAPHAVLIALGWLREADYVRDLAAYWGLPTVGADRIELPPRPAVADGAHAVAVDDGWFADPPVGTQGQSLWARAPDGRRLTVFDATREPPSVLALRIGRSRVGWRGCALSGRSDIEEAVQRRLRHTMLKRATWGLHRLAPDYSAASPITKRQAVRVGSLAGLAIGSIGVAPDVAIIAWTMALTIPFLFVVGVRLLAVLDLLGKRGAGAEGAERRSEDAASEPRIPDAELPVYTLLVPLYREAHMLAPLVAALQRIDYPQAKLDIRVVLEAADPETLAAAAAMPLPAHVSVIVVPDGKPRTKPKALNYALQFARGEFVGIYDAEDAPAPDQLRKAVAAFRLLGPETACLQAQLNIHNRDANWLTRQFTLEYSALFDALLPCLARLGLPLPLGGTSNHFRTRVLMASGGWDPFNVTEDADLGLRLHRLGWRTGVITSTTYEEAPERWADWLPQRTRWLKGWMQTYLVHTRGLSSELVTPTVRGRRLTTAIGVQVLLGGLLLSVLVHPIVYVLLASEIVSGQLFDRPQSLMGAGFWHIAIANFVIGFVASLLLSAITAWRRGYRALALRVATMPIYWLLISVAGYRALWQLVRDPYRWEKTAHGTHPAARK